MMTLTLVIKESMDIESTPEACQMVEIAIDALRHPDKPRPEGEFILGELTRQFVSFLHISTSQPLTSRWKIGRAHV